jgi:hypothetical protein
MDLARYEIEYVAVTCGGEWPVADCAKTEM